MRALSLSLLLALSLTAGAFAQSGSGGAPGAPSKAAPAKAAVLSVGDPAPALAVGKWVKGTPVEKFEPGKAYVVEFWATWCGPCIASIPHLTKLQQKHAGKATIIGVTSEDPNNSLEAVEALVAKQGDKMAYTVLWDKGRATNEAYMQAAQQRGIPCAFVVDGTGKIAYIGHPMNMDSTLEQVVAGTFDAAKAKAQHEERKANEAKLEKLDELFNDGKWAEGQALAKELMGGSLGEDPQFLNGIAWLIVDPEGPISSGHDVELALAAAEKANKLTEGKDPAILDTLAHAYLLKGDHAKAVETQRLAVAAAGDDARMKEELESSLKKMEAKAAEAKK